MEVSPGMANLNGQRQKQAENNLWAQKRDYQDTSAAEEKAIARTNKQPECTKIMWAAI